jgi:hypothetical protein
MGRTEEQAAQNEVAFRTANEELGRKRRELELEGTTPFLCECEDPACTTLVRLELSEYEHVRKHPRQFVVVPGHVGEWDRLVEEHDGFVIIEKVGAGGEIAERKNPRR